MGDFLIKVMFGVVYALAPLFSRGAVSLFG